MHSSWRKKLLLISASNLGVFCGSGYRNLCWCFMLDVMQPFIAWYWFWPGYQYFRPSRFTLSLFYISRTQPSCSFWEARQICPLLFNSSGLNCSLEFEPLAGRGPAEQSARDKQAEFHLGKTKEHIKIVINHRATLQG